MNRSSSANTVSVFAISADGTLTDAGIPAATGTLPRSMAVTGVYPPPFAYVTQRSRNSILTYTLDPVTGAITNTGTVLTGAQPDYLALDPFGRFLYVPIGGEHAIRVYSIDPATGALTQVGSSPVPPAHEGADPAVPSTIAIDPLGRFVYVGNLPSRGRDCSLVVYTIDQSTGLLTYVTSVGPWFDSSTGRWNSIIQKDMVVDPSGKYLYVMSGNGWYMRSYSIDQTTGVPEEVIADFRIPQENGTIAVDPFGRFLYTTMTNTMAPAVNAFSIDPNTGIPTFTGGVRTGDINTYVPTVEPSGRFAYALGQVSGPDGGSFIFEYSIDQATGALTTMARTEDRVGSFTVDPSGQFVYAYSGGAIAVFALDPFSGLLTRLDGLQAPTNGATRIVITPGRAPWSVLTAIPATVSPTTHRLGGTVTGLSGTAVLHNGGDQVTVTADGNFTFPTAIAEGASYSVSVTPPTSQTCSVEDGSGTMGAANVTNVVVTCTTVVTPTHTVGGSVTGLSGTAVLHNNGEDLPVTADGSFTFVNGVAEGASYGVSVTPPTSQTCSVENGSGTMGTANVTNVAVTCTTSGTGSNLGDVCDVNANTCTGNYPYCWNFNAFDPPGRCTMRCTADSECPVGSNGARNCNGDGYCRP